MSHEEMVALIRRRGVRDTLVLDALTRVPRDAFVPETHRCDAYGDYPLPIGYGQTISQPYIVALMTEALSLKSGERVLELGTGSGYQAALLAAMGLDVYTVERIPALYEAARARLDALGYTVHCKLDDGYVGWSEFAPYDGILVTAAPAEVPEPLWAQLAEGGRLVIPVGPPHGYQTLWKFIKHGDRIERVDMGGVAFVPFIHE
ncbi:MAG TPA: protein-L-isoaspartate(D-aspartate) O-methyltransferase [Anaerolineae bacterium]|nr:protein-L-isoaspartate(D-aspartate) O-methyltransferase [Anaerolineae bacterium]